MKTIYLMRHGQTLFNTMDLNQGQCDSPLTEAGIRQAKMAKDWYADHGIRFDAVYSSSLERACDTAEIVADMPYTRTKALKEIYLGTKEASPNSENPPYPYGDYFVKFGGEDLDAFTDRICHAIKEIADREEGQTILMVTHGMAIRRFLKAISCEKPIEGGFIGNCGIVELTYDNGNFCVERVIDVEHAV